MYVPHEINKSNEKNHPKLQEPEIRNGNFDEVSLGFDEVTAISEAKRCLDCKNKPCVSGCPVNVQIPEFIDEIANGNFDGAYRIIMQSNSLPAVCGRVCPQEKQCEAKCVRGIKGDAVAIGSLERFAADYNREHGGKHVYEIQKNGIKTAVIGSGPAGLTCASELAKMGYDVTVFEAFHTAGGVLMYGIPEFRLPKAIVQKEIDCLIEMGVKIETNMVIGKILTLDDLFEMDFKAIFIGSGAGLPQFMGIPGEGLIGVFSANEYLTRINLMKAYKNEYDTPITTSKNVAVIGAGNVAMDAARCAKRLGADNVFLVYRRTEEEMPARAEEIEHALEEKIELKTLTAPVEIIGDDKGYVTQIKCIKMRLGEPDDSGRRSPVPIEGSEFTIKADTVIMALGTTPNPLISSVTKGLDTNKRGCFIVNEDTATTLKGVYAGGDAATGAATVISAMGAGKRAAQAMHRELIG